MKISALLFGVFVQVSANAQEILPEYLTGFWGTAASLYEGTTQQVHIHIAADGYGLVIGSGAPFIRIDGADDGKPLPRPIIGFPFIARMDGDALIVQPFLPGKELTKEMARAVITCHYAAADETLTCAGPEGPMTDMRLQSARIPAEAEEMIERIRPTAR
jgi:hypothetical protein